MATAVATSPRAMSERIKGRLKEEVESILSQPVGDAERRLLGAVWDKFPKWVDTICNMPAKSFDLLQTYHLDTLLSADRPLIDQLVVFILVGTFDPVHWGHYQNLLAPFADTIEHQPGDYLPMAIMMPNGQYPPSLPGSPPGRAWKPGKACEQSRFAGVEHMTGIFAPLIQVSDIGRREPLRGTENAFALVSQLASTSVREVEFHLTVGSDSFNDWAETYVEFKGRHGHPRVGTIIQVILHKSCRLDPDKVDLVRRGGLEVVVTQEESLGLSSASIRRTGLSLLSPEMKRIRERYAPHETRRKELVIGLCAPLARLAAPQRIEDALEAYQYLLEPALTEFMADPSAHDRLCARYTEAFRQCGASIRVSRVGWEEPAPGEVRLNLSARNGAGGPAAGYAVAVATVRKADSEIPVWLQEQCYFVSVQNEGLP
jgi:hypothetical protein